MRRLVATVLLSLVSLPAFAQYFTANPLMAVRPDVVSAQVYNPYYEPIFCEGYAFGRTSWGNVYQAAFRDVLPPGAYRFAYVRTNAWGNPFVNGWAQIYCRFLRY